MVFDRRLLSHNLVVYMQAAAEVEAALRSDDFTLVEACLAFDLLTDVIPDEYVEAFKILRDDAPAMPFTQVKSTRCSRIA